MAAPVPASGFTRNFGRWAPMAFWTSGAPMSRALSKRPCGIGAKRRACR